MTKYKIKLIDIKAPRNRTLPKVEPQLNEMTNEGWELVSTIPLNMLGSTTHMLCIFKKKR